MNIIQKGKRQLIWLGVIVLILALAFLGGGIALIVAGAGAIAESAITVGVFEIIFGVVAILLGMIGAILAVVFLWTAGAMKATQGNISEDNLGIGTINMIKCPNCGTAVKDGEEFCSNCGKSLKKTKTCPHCNAEIPADAKHCNKCGQEVE